MWVAIVCAGMANQQTASMQILVFVSKLGLTGAWLTPACLPRESCAALLALVINNIVLIDLDDIRRLALRTT